MKPGDLLTIRANLTRCGITSIRQLGGTDDEIIIDADDMRAIYTPEEITQLAADAKHWVAGQSIDAYLV